MQTLQNEYIRIPKYFITIKGYFFVISLLIACFENYNSIIRSTCRYSYKYKYKFFFKNFYRNFAEKTKLIIKIERHTFRYSVSTSVISGVCQ